MLLDDAQVISVDGHVIEHPVSRLTGSQQVPGRRAADRARTGRQRLLGLHRGYRTQRRLHAAGHGVIVGPDVRSSGGAK
jgi:hypothetical protein